MFIAAFHVHTVHIMVRARPLLSTIKLAYAIQADLGCSTWYENPKPCGKTVLSNRCKQTIPGGQEQKSEIKHPLARKKQPDEVDGIYIYNRSFSYYIIAAMLEDDS